MAWGDSCKSVLFSRWRLAKFLAGLGKFWNTILTRAGGVALKILCVLLRNELSLGKVSLQEFYGWESLILRVDLRSERRSELVNGAGGNIETAELLILFS